MTTIEHHTAAASRASPPKPAAETVGNGAFSGFMAQTGHDQSASPIPTGDMPNAALRAASRSIGAVEATAEDDKRTDSLNEGALLQSVLPGQAAALPTQKPPEAGAALPVAQANLPAEETAMGPAETNGPTLERALASESVAPDGLRYPAAAIHYHGLVHDLGAQTSSGLFLQTRTVDGGTQTRPVGIFENHGRPAPQLPPNGDPILCDARGAALLQPLQSPVMLGFYPPQYPAATLPTANLTPANLTPAALTAATDRAATGQVAVQFGDLTGAAAPDRHAPMPPAAIPSADWKQPMAQGNPQTAVPQMVVTETGKHPPLADNNENPGLERPSSPPLAAHAILGGASLPPHSVADHRAALKRPLADGGLAAQSQPALNPNPVLVMGALPQPRGGIVGSLPPTGLAGPFPISINLKSGPAPFVQGLAGRPEPFGLDIGFQHFGLDRAAGPDPRTPQTTLLHAPAPGGGGANATFAPPPLTLPQIALGFGFDPAFDLAGPAPLFGSGGFAALPTAQPQTAPQIVLPVPVMAIPAQISAQIASGKPAAMEVTLSPEALGKIRLHLTPDGDTLRVVLQAERPDTMELLRRNIEAFAAELRQSGFANTSFSFSGWGNAPQDAPKALPPAPAMQTDSASAAAVALAPPPKLSHGTGLDLRV